MSVKFRIWSDYALFTRPEMKVERVSYDIITPSAARGICDAIFWHPGLHWKIDKITVCSPIRFTNVRRNEVKSVISCRNVKTVMEKGKGDLYLASSEDIQQRAALLLKNVEYVIDAHFEMTPQAAPSDNPGKFQDIMRRRIEKGQFYHQPCMGCREFPAHFAPCHEVPPCPDELKGDHDLGYMLYDMDYSDSKDIRPLFFRAKLHDGVLKVPERDSGEVIG